RGNEVERSLSMELVRVTEAAALASARWMGRGKKNEADDAATSAMRTVFDTVPMQGTVVIGKINNIAMDIYEEDKKEYEILALIEYTNKYATKNHIGFLLHILKEKEKIYNNAGNPSIIENELNNHFKNSEVIPEWFEKKQKNEDRSLTPDINTEEMQELKDLLAKHSSTKTNSKVLTSSFYMYVNININKELLYINHL